MALVRGKRRRSVVVTITINKVGRSARPECEISGGSNRQGDRRQKAGRSTGWRRSSANFGQWSGERSERNQLLAKNRLQGVGDSRNDRPGGMRFLGPMRSRLIEARRASSPVRGPEALRASRGPTRFPRAIPRSWPALRGQRGTGRALGRQRQGPRSRIAADAPTRSERPRAPTGGLLRTCARGGT